MRSPGADGEEDTTRGIDYEIGEQRSLHNVPSAVDLSSFHETWKFYPEWRKRDFFMH